MLRRLVLLLLALASARPAHALQHLISIVEVFPGTGADPGAQYVELQAYFASQNQVAGHPVIFYDAAGVESGRVAFGPAPGGNLPNGANQMSVLIGTSSAATLFGISLDLTMPAPLINPAGGKICWDTFDCFAWGNYSGPPGAGTLAVGTPFPALQAGVSARRRLDVAGNPNLLESTDDTGSSIGDFASGFPAPRNNGNAVGPEDQDGIAPGSDKCPFLANPLQADADLDGRGDACECGDQSGDGLNTVADLVAINLAIFEPARVTPLCDANGDGACNVADIVAANVEIFSPTSTSTCAAQPVPGPPPAP
jgi:hypothetical protein